MPDRRSRHLSALVVDTTALLQRALSRRDARAAFAVAALGYPLFYLVALGHLAATGDGGLEVSVVADPLARAFTARGPFNYEPVAAVNVGPLFVLVSPLNLLIGGLLALLVAANVAVAVVSWRAPAACGADVRTGPLAGVLGLLSGATCCGPALLFLLGIQATGTLVSAFGVLVPIAAATLVGTLLLAGHRAAPSERTGETAGSTPR